MSSALTLQWATLPDREGLVCEIWLGDEQLAEVNAETSELAIEVYPRRDGTPWVMPMSDLMSAFQRAQLGYAERGVVVTGEHG